MNEPLTTREMQLLLAKLAHLISRDPPTRTAIESLIRGKEQQGLLNGVSFENPTTEIPY